MTQIKAHYDGSRVVIDENVTLEPNTQLTLLVEDDKVKKNGDGEEVDIMKLFGEPFDMGIEDLSENLDHYLYGLPKKPRP